MTEPRAGVVIGHGKVRMEFVVTSAESAAAQRVGAARHRHLVDPTGAPHR
jgi:hypothetical protein